MIRNVLVLPDGTVICTGSGYAIKQSSSIRCVNSGTELTIGSVCTNKIAYTIYDVGGSLSLAAGEEVTLYSEQDGRRIKRGIYRLEKPTRPTANTIKLTGYDRVTMLDRDLTEWLASLSGWPYNILTFARMVCQQCGVSFVTESAPNDGFTVHQFAKTGVTGRQIMQWVSEICCRFCRANADGNIEFAWYTPSGVTIRHTGQRYYFSGALSYETYRVSKVQAVQIRPVDNSYGALWPSVDSELNSYIIADNAILNARITDELSTYLNTIRDQLSSVEYTPCKLSIPACLDVDAGNTVDIVDKNGALITAYVMTKTTTGQKDTIECTGSQRRDSPTAVNNRTPSAGQAAIDAFADLTQQQVFDKLTDNGKIQGIYVQDDKWYINAEIAKIINLSADGIDTTNLKVSAANITGVLTVKNAAGSVLLSAGDNAVTIAGWKADSNSLYSGESFSAADCFLCTGSVGNFDIAGSGPISGWVLKAGSRFGVTKDGIAYLSNAHISGEIRALSGKVAEWTISGRKLLSGDGSTVKTVAIQAPTAAEDYVFAAGGSSHDNYDDCPWRVTAAGKMYSSDADIAGKINAKSGAIGSWNIGNVTVVGPDEDKYSGPALYSDPFYDSDTRIEMSVALTPERVYIWGRDSDGSTREEDASWIEIIRAAQA